MTSPHIFILLFLLALSSTTGLRAQETDSRVDNYLSAIEAKQDQSSPGNNQYRAWYWAILGDEQKAYDAFCETEAYFCEIESIEKKAGSADIDTVLSTASQADIFILNEAHHASRHRAFATTLLPALKEQGYTHLAAEALEFVTRERIEKGQYPATNGNLYLQDPHFADMLVTAHKLGFTLVEYEQTQEQRQNCTAENRTERINCRERAQEENLLSAISQDGELKRTVVFVGFNHANLCAKDTEFGQERRLAHLLAKRHPGQVLSTTQTTAFAPSDEVESGRPHIFNKAAKDGEYCQNFEVIHSEPEQRYERDSWLFTLAGREPVHIDLPDTLKDKEIIIRAHHKGADIDGKYPETPFDQFVFKGARATLALKPEGDYTLSALLGETFVPLGQVSNGHYMPAP